MKKENGSKYDNDEQTILKRIIGKSNETDVAINGQICKGLIDSGSNITTMCDKSRDLQVSVATRFCRVLIFASS